MTAPHDPNVDTEMQSTLRVLKLLADDTRWRLINALRWSDYQVGELVEQLELPQNLVSYHLNVLRQARLVQAHRSDADARVLYYGLDSAALQVVHRQIGASLYLPGVAPTSELPALTVFFLCTANSARSQMAEGWLRHIGGGRLRVRSAGTTPRPIHPLAIQAMDEAGIDISHQSAKGLDALVGLSPDVVITVCDLAREQCPTWSGVARRIHWSIPDPAMVEGSLADQIAAFRTARDLLRTRVEALPPLLVACVRT